MLLQKPRHARGLGRVHARTRIHARGLALILVPIRALTRV